MTTQIKSVLLGLLMVSSFAVNANNKPTSNKQFIKVALLLDTSNSMDGLIDQAKAQLWEIVNELSYAKCEGERPNLQIALYEYGNDRLNSDEGYIRQVIGFSDDLDDISKNRSNIWMDKAERTKQILDEISKHELHNIDRDIEIVYPENKSLIKLNFRQQSNQAS